MKNNESAENYLETIYMLSKIRPVVRSVDIAEELGFKKSSVSVAMRRLRENGYIQMEHDGYITLLPAGLEIAQRIYKRHRLLSQFLEHLGVSPQNAVADACKIEHDISTESFEKLMIFAKKHQLLDEDF